MLQRAEDFAGWLLHHTARWPRSARHTLTARVEARTLEVLDALVIARYRRTDRLARLDAANLDLERLRYLLRIARSTQACPAKTHEGACRRIDEIGRMLHGWRSGLRANVGATA